MLPKIRYVFSALRPFHSLNRVPDPSFEDFVRERFPIAERWPLHCSAFCYVQFLGPDGESAFDLYVTLRRDYFAAHPPTAIELTIIEKPTLDNLLDAVRQRPRMYFTRTPDLMGCLIALLNGSTEAERCHLGVSPMEAVMEGFQLWLNRRHSWALGRPWDEFSAYQISGTRNVL